MTAIRRNIIRRVHRETGRHLREIVRTCKGLTAAEIARRHLSAQADSG